tara:strand:- start:395 stop:613 length:219 start_codon:yes stop_codon:yes gene_type:complete
VSNSFDWPALMRLGMCTLRLKPDEFWRLSPLELNVMLGQSDISTSLDRSGLAALEKRFPDIGTGPSEGLKDD